MDDENITEFPTDVVEEENEDYYIILMKKGVVYDFNKEAVSLSATNNDMIYMFRNEEGVTLASIPTENIALIAKKSHLDLIEKMLEAMRHD